MSKSNQKIIFFLCLVVLIMVSIKFFSKPNRKVSESIKPAILVKTTPVLDKKIIYLTFDADMTPSMKQKVASGKAQYYDPKLISYLETNHIPATFFVTGMFAEVYSDVVKQIAANPDFTIGNHTYDHRAFEYPCYKLPAGMTDTEKIDEVEKTQKIISDLTNQTPKYFRFPGLCANSTDYQLVQNLGLKIPQNEIASGDAFAKDPDRVAANVVAHAKEGSVVVMHMGGDNAQVTAKALVEFVPKLEAKGYVFESLK
jgi:peptidoglycan/xylan/chitin deacetylase (PgdA/CDA1 family)